MIDTPQALAAELRRTAILFRIGMQGAGNEAMVGIVDGIVGLLQRGALPAAAIPALNPLLGEILAAQGGHDEIHLADLLEYRLLPLVGGG